MSLEDEIIKNRYKRLNKYRVITSHSNRSVPTKFSSKSIFSKDDISFKVRKCDKNQLKMILYDKGLLKPNCHDPSSIILDNLTEKEIIEEIKNTTEIFNKLNDLDNYILMRILFKNTIDFSLKSNMFKYSLINTIVSNINYKCIESEINIISQVNTVNNDNMDVINLINKIQLFDDDFKEILKSGINSKLFNEDVSKFVISLNNDLINNNYQKSSYFNEDYVKKYFVIENPYSNRLYFFNHDKSKDIPVDIEENKVCQNKVKSWDFEFSKTDKQVRKPLYDYQKVGMEVELNNDAINQMEKILKSISLYELTDENREIISHKIDEINAFIKKHNLTFKKVNDKKREIQQAFNDFCDRLEESKYKNLKTQVNDIYNDLTVNNLNFVEIGEKYPNFYSFLSEDEVSNYVNKLIESDQEFSDELNVILDSFINTYDNVTRKMYNSVIKKLKAPKYIDMENFENTKRDYNNSVSYFMKLNKLKEYFNNFKKVSFKTFDVESLIEKHNQQLMKREYLEHKIFFDNFNGYEIDEDQRKIILSDEKTSKIIAGAGSGKTFTLLGKIKYLLDYKEVPQNKILCISYSNASVNDLNEKINEIIGRNDIDVFTFHKLGGEILKSNSEKYIPNNHLLHETIENYFEKYIISDTKKVKKIIDFFSIHNHNSKDNEDDLNFVKIGNLAELRNSQEFATLKDQICQLTDYEFNVKHNDSIEDIKTVDRYFVRSFEELIIANFLFINNINYIYEDDFFKRKNADPEDGYTLYRPDFYLPEYDIYIEHYGVDRNLEAKQLDALNRNEYKRSIYWKRDIHKKYNSTLIETFSYENWEGNLLKNLEEKLKKHKVEFSELNYSMIYERLIKNKKLDELQRVIKVIENFITLFKTNGFNIDDNGNVISDMKFNEILKEIKTSDDHFKTRNLFLFDIIRDIYNLYVEQEGIDFNDMINNPIRLLNSDCKLKDYDYIFVDEYQDISYSRYRLLKEIVDRTHAKLIVVGDDWQSIYSFSGCQIGLFSNFDDYFNYSKEFKIEKNYRNSEDLINVSSRFVLENKFQIRKELKADKNDPKKPIKLAKYRYVKDFSLIFEDMIKEISYNNPDGEILILGRYNDDFKQVIIPGLFETDNFYTYEKALKEDGYLNIRYLEDKSVKIKFRSIHKSKGLEADNVIIIGLKSKERKGFPSKMTDDSIIKFVLNKTKEDTRDAEERRLFYVALTRSENNVYLLSDEKEPSEFIEDLAMLDKDNKIEFRRYNFSNDDFKRMDLFMENKFNKRTPFQTKLKCSKCDNGEIILYKKGTGKGFFRCSSCNFDFGAFNQSPDLIDTLDYCNVDGCDGLSYVKEEDGVKRKICSYYGKTGCDGGNDY